MTEKKSPWSPLRALRWRIDRRKSIEGLPPMPSDIYLAEPARRTNWTRIILLFLGVAVFLVIYFWPSWGTAVDPAGREFPLTREGKGALALFCLAAIWWVFEVVPIGITGITIGVLQALFLIRPARNALGDFMDPAIWFIIGSLIIGKAFTKTGLTQRFIYKTLSFAGDNTGMIVLSAFALIALLTLTMAHIAVAAALFPLLMAIHSLYDDSGKATRFGKGMFIGMAYASGAGSIVSLLGSARAPAALSFWNVIAGKDVSFFNLIYYMLPLSWGMILLLWLFVMLKSRPERKVIPGLREKMLSLGSKMGKITPRERGTMIIVLLTILAMGLKPLVPLLETVDIAAILMAGTVLLFLFNIIDIKDLEDIPWNIVLLFGGAMSIGFCFWQTGAAGWLAVSLLGLLGQTPWLVFILAAVFFVMIATNFIMNVAAIAIALPVALIIAGYIGVAQEIVFYTLLAAAGMPFMLLIGAAPNAIAFESRQFTQGEFFRYGLQASLIFMGLMVLFILVIWPLMGMPILLGR